MQAEIEAKFLQVDHGQIRAKLKELNATCVQPKRITRRKNFDFMDQRLQKVNGWVRVRDEGDKVTLAYKQLDNRDVDGTKEVSVIVDSFENTCLLLKSIGMVAKSYQETKRESWLLDGVEVELDEWPWIPPYVEIEAPDSAQLFGVARKIGLDIKQAVHGSVEIAYQQIYEVTDQEIDEIKEILFTKVPNWLEERRK